MGSSSALLRLSWLWWLGDLSGGERLVANQNPVGVELRNLRVAQIGKLVEQALVILAETSRTHFGAVRPSREFYRDSGNRDFAELRILDPTHRLALVQMRMLDGLVDR